MRNQTIAHDDTIRRDVAEAALGHALDALADVREDRDTYRELLGVALRQVAALTDRVREQNATLRQLATRNGLLLAQAQGWQTRRRAA